MCVLVCVCVYLAPADGADAVYNLSRLQSEGSAAFQLLVPQLQSATLFGPSHTHTHTHTHTTTHHHTHAHAHSHTLAPPHQHTPPHTPTHTHTHTHTHT